MRHAANVPVIHLALALLVATAAVRCASRGPGGGDPGERLLLWQIGTPGDQPMSIALDETPDRLVLYAAMKEGGLAIFETPSYRESPAEVARIDRDALGGHEAMYLTRAGSRLYVALGNFFGGDHPAGLAVVDVTDPADPVVSDVWVSEEATGGSASVVVDGDLAWLAAMEEGIVVLDVSDPASIRPVASFRPDVDFPRPDPGRIQHPNARGMAKRGGLLYVAYDAGGLRVLDVSDPERIREIGRHVNPEMRGKQQAYNHVVVDGPYAYAAVDYCGLEIVDVRDPSDPRPVGWWNPWRCDRGTNVWFNSPGHTNELAVEGGRVFLSAGDEELVVVDVSIPKRPRLEASYGRSKDDRGAWGMTAGRDAVYLAYIRAPIPFRGTWSGIRAISRRALGTR